MRKQAQRGYTLFELLVVLSATAILSAIAVPAYQDYMIRAQVAEATTLVASAKTSVALAHDDRGTFVGIDNAVAGMADPTSISGTYVSQVNVANGVIMATFGGHANSHLVDQILILSPTMQPGSFLWTCRGGTPLLLKYLPSACR